jgi:eukaryotic-like serine/threonine-protein kinase
MGAGLERLFERFAEVRALPEPSRRVALRAIEDSDPETAREVREMLEAEADRSGHFLDRPLARLEAEPEEETPARIGPYVVVREIGRGTFGRVFLAEREGPAPIRAAVKVLHSFRTARQTVRRFEREMRALAEVADPGIARLLDAGVDAEGVPYLATEYVDGLPVDVFCRERGLGPLERVGLVAQVCRAVHHAHQRSIVHRDIKPSNVLVGGADGRARVIDFGIAKLLAPSEEQITVETGSIGTPGFMSPEQRAGERVDVRSDVYSLGVLLACVLTGTRPTDGPEGPRTAGEMMASYSGPRAADLALLVRLATEPELERRLPSAAHLGEELGRIGAGLPIMARPASVPTLAALYARRNPGVAALLLALGVLAAVLAGRLVLVNANLARVVRNQSEMIAETTGVVTKQLGVLAGTAEARRTLVDGLLERAAALKASGVEDPSLEIAIAQLLGASGDLAKESGDLAEALRIREEVAARGGALLRAGALDVEQGRWHAEAIVRVGEIHLHMADRETALQYFEEGRAAQYALLEEAGRGHVGLLDDICWSWDRIGNIQRRLPGHEDSYARSVETRHRLAGRLLSLDPERTLSVFNLATAEYKLHQLQARRGEHDAAGASLARAKAMLRPLVDAEPNRTAFARIHILCLVSESGRALSAGDVAEARRVATEALEIAERLYRTEPNHVEARFAVIDALRQLARVEGISSETLGYEAELEAFAEQFRSLRESSPDFNDVVRGLISRVGQTP